MNKVSKFNLQLEKMRCNLGTFIKKENNELSTDAIIIFLFQHQLDPVLVKKKMMIIVSNKHDKISEQKKLNFMGGVVKVKIYEVYTKMSTHFPLGQHKVMILR